MNTAVENFSENSILRWWHRLSGLPTGAWWFSRFLGWYAPYSGTIGSRVEILRPGFAQVSLRDRRKVRNHLKSIHAIALMNLGEIATGLAVLSTITPDMRGIVLGLQAEYLKKSRGRLVAKASFELPSQIDDNTPCEAKTEIVDDAGDVVAIVRATWLLGYKKLND
jgi:acyl-coenzyme A thioesterase PaaI-like protein